MKGISIALLAALFATGCNNESDSTTVKKDSVTVPATVSPAANTGDTSSYERMPNKAAGDSVPN